jgi:hypothetical protein
LLDEAKFEEIDDGLCVQMLHVGSYDDEPKTFAVMQEFLAANNLKRRSTEHKEIYMSDPRRVEKDKLKTVLRYYVKEKK